MFTEVLCLLKRDFQLEWKQKYVINGLLIYTLSTIFICYLSFKRLTDVPTWNALLWIIILFTSVNIAAKGFSTGQRARLLYFYYLTSARSVILSRIIYNSILMLFINFFGCLIYFLLIGDLVNDKPFFLLGILIGSMGFSSLLTLLSSISGRTENITLMAILSFPVILPFLLVLIRFSKNAVDGISHSVQNPYLISMLAINVIVIALATILFPYVWKE